MKCQIEFNKEDVEETVRSLVEIYNNADARRITSGDVVSVAVDVQTFLQAILFFCCFDADIKYEIGYEKG